jgi:two-component system, LytTR family, response regulator LytT
MKEIRCIIVDDEPLALDLMEKYVKKTPFLILVARCKSAFEAMEVIKNKPVDLVFLDIQMPELSGIDFSRMIQHGPKVIFTTAFENYAIEGYKVDGLDYLLKPFNYDEFLRAANKAAAWFDFLEKNRKETAVTPDSIYVRSEYKLLKIYLNDIIYIEGLKDYAKFFLKGQERPVLSLMSLKKLEQNLPEDKFMRVHRSFIVNMDHIEAIERGDLIVGEKKIPVAEGYKETLQAFLNKRFLG